jgi:hypothetical protein
MLRFIRLLIPSPLFSMLTVTFSASSSGAAAQRIGGYLDNLASGSTRTGGSGIQNYLSAIGTTSSIQGSASAVKSYLDAMSAGATAAPSAPVVKDYLDNMSSGATSAPTTGSGIASYLSALGGSANVLSGGAGIKTHVDTLASSTQLSGGGIKGYLDIVGGAAPSASVAAQKASSIPGTPSTKIDTQVSHNGLQTTITITSVTTVVIDDA